MARTHFLCYNRYRYRIIKPPWLFLFSPHDLPQPLLSQRLDSQVVNTEPWWTMSWCLKQERKKGSCRDLTRQIYVCLSVRLNQINVKTAEPIGPNFVRNAQNYKILCHQVFDFCKILKMREKILLNPRPFFFVVF